MNLFRPMSIVRSSRMTSLLLSVAVAAAAALSGCGVSGSSAPGAPVSAVLSGRAQGGQQPIQNASIYLAAAGSTGNGTGASNLLTKSVFTASDGSFTITGDYTCPSSTTQVYLVASGGNPGISSSTNNTASLLIAALGDCGSLTSSTYIWVNEETTAAAAWALAGFLGPQANVGSTATNATGLRNAFLIANNLVNTTNGTAGGAGLPTGATFESAKLNSLANAMSTCVNSNGGSACSALFTAATVGNVVPVDTLDAALAIVKNPTSNVTGVFNAALPTAPFQPGLTKAPHDWTMSINYKGGGLANPTGVAVDSKGNIWAANYFGGVATMLSATGVPASSSGYSDPNLNESWSLTIDNQDSAWITNEQGDPSNGYNGSLSKFSSTGQLLSGSGFYAGNVYYPYGVAADANGDVWVADFGHSQATLMANNGSGIASYSSTSLPFPVAAAVDGSHNGWFAGLGSATMVTPAGAITQYSCCREPAGIAIDENGGVWIADYSASSVVELSSGGTGPTQTLTGGGLTNPNSIAIDGAGAAWVANYRGNSFSAFTGYSGAQGAATSTAISPSTGFGLDAPLGQPFGIALDASGNVWISNFGGASLTQFVGLATPVKTPLNGPAAVP